MIMKELPTTETEAAQDSEAHPDCDVVEALTKGAGEAVGTVVNLVMTPTTEEEILTVLPVEGAGQGGVIILPGEGAEGVAAEVAAGHSMPPVAEVPVLRVQKEEWVESEAGIGMLMLVEAGVAGEEVSLAVLTPGLRLEATTMQAQIPATRGRESSTKMPLTMLVSSTKS